MKSHVGRILKFDGIAHDQNISRYTPIVLTLEKVKKIYESLDPSFTFTNEIWLDMQRNKIKNISDKYNSIIATQLSDAKFTAKALVLAIEIEGEKNLLELSIALEKVFTTASEQEVNASRVYLINLEFIVVQSGKIILSEEGIKNIRARYEHKIETPVQNEFYTLLVEMQKSYKALRAFTASHTNFANEHNLIGNRANDFLQEVYTGELDINPTVLGFLK